MARLVTRLISGKGILKLDANNADYKKAKVFSLFADVSRRPTSEYKNYSYNPPRSRYATLNFFRSDYLVRSEPLEFPKQQWDFYLDQSGQSLYAIQCAYAGILQSFVNLGAALGAVPISVTDGIKDWAHIDLMWDTIKVVCYADTAVNLVVSTVAFNQCTYQSGKTPSPPPPPPNDPAPPSIPAGTGLGNGTTPNVSPPYSSPNDGGDTVPYPGDTTTPPTPPYTGQRFNVVIQWFINDNASNGRTSNIIVWGSVISVRSIAISGQGRLQLLCYGAAPTVGTAPSSTPVYVDVLPPDSNPNRYGNVNQPSIVSSTPV